jgi:hypothetical protein
MESILMEKSTVLGASFEVIRCYEPRMVSQGLSVLIYGTIEAGTGNVNHVTLNPQVINILELVSKTHNRYLI